MNILMRYFAFYFCTKSLKSGVCLSLTVYFSLNLSSAQLPQVAPGFISGQHSWGSPQPQLLQPRPCFSKSGFPMEELQGELFPLHPTPGGRSVGQAQDNWGRKSSYFLRTKLSHSRLLVHVLPPNSCTLDW